MAAQDLLPNKIRACHPKQFFDTLISKEFFKRCIMNTTNARAVAKGSSFVGTQYTDFEPFDLAEAYKMIGLLFVNGLAPRPLFTMWFKHHYIFVSEFIEKAMNKHMAHGKQPIQGIRHWKHF